VRPRAPAHAFFSTGDGVTCSLCWDILLAFSYPLYHFIHSQGVDIFVCLPLMLLRHALLGRTYLSRCVVWDGGGNSLFGALLLLSAVLVQLSSMYFWRTSFTLNYPGVNGGGYGGLFLHVATFKRCGKTNLQNEIGFRLLQQTTTTRTPPWNLPTNAPKNM
jgi:hypothetical protein